MLRVLTFFLFFVQPCHAVAPYVTESTAVDENFQHVHMQLKKVSTQALIGDKAFTGVVSGVGLFAPGDFKWKISISSSCGSGWLRADGSSISKTTYPGLFAEFGYSFGGSDDNFSLPDMSNGEFVRAVSTYTAGGDVTLGMGTKQADALQGHYHTTAIGTNAGTPKISIGASLIAFTNNVVDSSVYGATTISTDASYGTVRVASETRPRNYAMIPCIYSGVK